MTRFAQAGSLDPAEDLFDPFADALADGIAGVAGGPTVDGRAAVAGVLGDIRGGAEAAHVRHEILGVVGLVGAHRDGASMSSSAHLTQMFDSTIVRAHVSAAGAKGGKTVRRLAVHEEDSPQKFTPKQIIAET